MFCKFFIESNIYVASYLCNTNFYLDKIEVSPNRCEVERGVNVKTKWWSDARTGMIVYHY